VQQWLFVVLHVCEQHRLCFVLHCAVHVLLTDVLCGTKKEGAWHGFLPTVPDSLCVIELVACQQV
jgi:hypothetical protein